jgi:hypothetical protein
MWQEHEREYNNMAWLVSLPRALGRSIDAVEAQMGGATRQVLGDHSACYIYCQPARNFIAATS